MLKVFEDIIPLRMKSVANTHAHWANKYKIAKQQKKCVWASLHRQKPKVTTPCTIRLGRIAPRDLDEHDNLRTSFKAIVDEICSYIHPNLAPGRADSDKNIQFEYFQERGAPKTYAIKVEIYCQ